MRIKPSFHGKDVKPVPNQDDAPTCECCNVLVDARTASRIINRFGALLCMACYIAGATADNRAQWEGIAAQVIANRNR